MLTRLEAFIRSLPPALKKGVGVALCLGGLLFYFRADADRLLKVQDHYDLTYYYLSSKYPHELGYGRFYEALLIADEEGERRWRGIREYRDLEDYRHRPRGDALKQAEAIKAHFTPERWEAFKHDVAFFSRSRIGSSWSYFFLDHGYNPPPMWTLMGGLFSRAVPVEHLKWICSVDLVLLALMFFFIWRAFGNVAVFLALMFFTTTFSGTWPVAGHALLRFDWLTLTVMAMCAFQLRRPALAGALLGYAASMRIFPAVFFLPFFAVWVYTLVAERRRDVATTRTLVAGAVSVGALALFAFLLLGSTAFVEGAQKIALHASPESYSSSRVGFGDFLVFRGETSRAEMGLYGGTLGKAEELWALQPYVRWVGLLAILLVGLWTIARSRERPHLGMPLTFLPLFLLTTPQINYFNVRVLLLVWAAVDGHRLRRWVAPALLFSIELMAFRIDEGGLRYTTTSMTSVGLTVLSVFLVATVLHELLVVAPREGEVRPRFLGRLTPRQKLAVPFVLAALVVIPYLPTWARHRARGEPKVVEASSVVDLHPQGNRWDEEGTTLMERGGLIVRYADVQTAPGLELTVDSNDRYRLSVLKDGRLVHEEELEAHPRVRVRGLQRYVVELPAGHEGYDEVRLRPVGGDGRFSLGHLVGVVP